MTKRIALGEARDPAGKLITVVATVPDSCPNPALPAKPYQPADREVSNPYQVANLRQGDVIVLSFINEAGADVADPGWRYEQINDYQHLSMTPTYSITMPAPRQEGTALLNNRTFGQVQFSNGLTYIGFAVETTVVSATSGGTSPGVYFHYYGYNSGQGSPGSIIAKYNPDTGAVIKRSPPLPDTFPGISVRYVNREDGRIWAGDNRDGGTINGIQRGLLGWASIDDDFTETSWTTHRLTGAQDANRNASLLTVVPVGDFIYGVCSLRPASGSYYDRDTFIIKGKLDGTGTYEVKATYTFNSARQGNDSESEAECPVAFGKYILFAQEGRHITGYDTETDTFVQLMTAPEDRDTNGAYTTDVDLSFPAGRAQDGSIWGYGIDEAQRDLNAGFYRSTLDNPVGVRVGPRFVDSFYAYTGAGMVDEPYYRVAVNSRSDYSLLRLHRVHMDTLVVELDVGSVRFSNGNYSVSQSGKAVAAGNVRAIPGDGPYQPPGVAKHGNALGDLAFE